MLVDNGTLLEGLNSVTAIPILPFRDGEIDYDAHAKNVDYLMRNNHLDNGRKRVLSVAGTSLIHHVSPEEQNRVFEETGRAMGKEGILMSSIVPNPIATAGSQVETQSKFSRPPDVYLLMPLSGTFSPDGMYRHFMGFGQKYGEEHGARFLYYHRNARDLDAVIRLLNDSPHFVGVKVGTSEQDVKPLLDGVGDNAMVIWGIGDRSTSAAEAGAKGHTSGIAVLYAKASDGINNAQRRGDYKEARRLEEDIHELEEIRFMDGRAYNYSAVVEAMRQSEFEDIDPGDGSGPFNPPVPEDVAARISVAIRGLEKYH